jgi:hypothetical protein
MRRGELAESAELGTVQGFLERGRAYRKASLPGGLTFLALLGLLVGGLAGFAYFGRTLDPGVVWVSFAVMAGAAVMLEVRDRHLRRRLRLRCRSCDHRLRAWRNVAWSGACSACGAPLFESIGNTRSSTGIRRDLHATFVERGEGYIELEKRLFLWIVVPGVVAAKCVQLLVVFLWIEPSRLPLLGPIAPALVALMIGSAKLRRRLLASRVRKLLLSCPQCAAPLVNEAATIARHAGVCGSCKAALFRGGPDVASLSIDRRAIA